jgi:hypothetical protein
MDFNYYRHVGYSGANWTESLFSDQTVKGLQTLIQEKTKVWVPSENVKNVIDGVLVNYRPTNLNPMTRNTQLPLDNPFDDAWQKILLESAAIIVGQVNADLGLREESKKLTRWTGTIYGEDVNREQLRQHPPIKLSLRRPDSFQFHMRY